MLAPVQVLVLTVTDTGQGDEVITVLRSVHPDGPVRLLDAFVVTVAADGTLELGGDVNSGPPVSAALFLQPEGTGEAVPTAEPEVWHLGEVVPAGSVAVVALLEHRWATQLRNVLLGGGGAVRYETWLTPDDRDELEALLSA